MQKDELSAWLLQRYPGMKLVSAWGEEAFFYNPDQRLPRGVYFATLKDKNGEHDQASALDREGVYRLNFGVSSATYQQHLGSKPARPAAGQVVNLDMDFTCLNKLLPHPVYAWMGWMSILNPDASSLQTLQPLLDEAYERVVKKYKRRTGCG
ncbi:DUF6194 family protein [Marinospirillum perlucidum]|uniref:DUF6194 family protein n=1 Tax=Marinospirillum perlucidum TaxID=1982602 RepID=UPI001C49A898|nr:DUF6194 family protein [Marinospirillum perlucidum]